jgi:hypothetical protein
MTTKKAKATENPLQGLFDICPYPVFSDFERENFQNQTGTAYARYIIDIINRIRKIDSDLETETRTFETKCLQAEKEKLQKFLEGEDQKELESALTNWEFVEKEYWANTLGKQAAIEILTLGRPSLETMNKMVKLPEELYVKSTQTCVRLANAIQSATERAEVELGYQPSTDKGPKKLALKKVK